MVQRTKTKLSRKKSKTYSLKGSPDLSYGGVQSPNQVFYCDLTSTHPCVQWIFKDFSQVPVVKGHDIPINRCEVKSKKRVIPEKRSRKYNSRSETPACPWFSASSLLRALLRPCLGHFYADYLLVILSLFSITHITISDCCTLTPVKERNAWHCCKGF